jgi:5'(3')-deoxyribonucleotidase
MKKIIYIDMDNVVVDFPSAFPKISQEILTQFFEDKDEIPHIFSLMEPMEGAIESVEFLAKHFDVYFLSTAPWENPTAWSDKLRWIKQYLPEIGYKRLILSHNKHLNVGDYLIDDRIANGANKFSGEFIHFGKQFSKWHQVVNYICKKENVKTDDFNNPDNAPLKLNNFRYRLRVYIDGLAASLHSELFPEEYDFVFDSTADSTDRERSKNPISKTYLDTVNLRRETNTVTPLDSKGLPQDNTSKIHCYQLISNFINDHIQAKVYN